MSTSSKSATAAHDIKQNIMRLGVVALFVMVVGFAGGAFTDNTSAVHAVGSSTDLLAAVGTVNLGGKTYSVSNTPGGGYAASYNGKTANFNCSGGSCTATVDGNNIGATEDELKKLTSGASDDDAQKCLKGEGDECRNKCTTSYVTVDSSGKPTPKDCYKQGEDRTKGAYKAIIDLAICMQNEAGKQGTTDTNGNEPTLKQALCVSKAKVIQNTELQGKPIDVLDENNNSIRVPSACNKELQRVLDLRDGKADVQQSASKGDDTACAWKGPAVCVSNAVKVAGVTVNGGTTDFTCINKAQTQSDTPAPTPADPCADKSGIGGFTCRIGQGFGDVGGGALDNLKKLLGGGQPSGGGGGGGEQSGAKNPCPTGYKQQEKDGRNVCVEDPNAKKDNAQCPTGYKPSEQKTTSGTVTCIKDAPAAAPKCLLVASKNKVAKGEAFDVHWRTANAEKVNITSVGQGLPLNGDKSITLQTTTNLELTATAADGTTKETCAQNVVVDDTQAPTEQQGSEPPQMSCTPNTIERGDDATVQWACTSTANDSAGEGIATRGALSGSADVSPTHNTEYTVECMADDKVIGKNSCAVNVGVPVYDILAYPTEAGAGDRIRISWGSLFMKSCRVQGPRGFDYTRAQGVVITEPFSAEAINAGIKAAVYTIECASQFGGSVSRDIKIEFTSN